MRILITENQLKHIADGVGDKYAEKEFGIPNDINIPEPSEHDVIVVNREKNPIIKNPSNPNSIGDYTRGVIDDEGNLYLEKRFEDVHNYIIQQLIKANQINFNFNYDWVTEDPDKLGFITIQYVHGNVYIGSSHKFRLLDDKESESLKVPIPNEWNKRSNLPKFKKFMDLAKVKNPNFNFIPEIFKPKQ